MRIYEFFEDDNGRLSMPRLAVFCTLPPAIWIMLHDYDKIDVVLAAYVLNYGIGKVGDALRSNNQLEANSIESSSTVVASTDTTRQVIGKRVKTGKRRPF